MYFYFVFIKIKKQNMSTSTNNLLRKLILLNLNFKVNYWAACKHLGHVDFHKGVKVNCTAFFINIWKQIW